PDTHTLSLHDALPIFTAQNSRSGAPNADESVSSPGAAAGTAEQFAAMLRAPELRDPRGFILPSDQPDFATATKFMNTLLKVGVRSEEHTSELQSQSNL